MVLSYMCLIIFHCEKALKSVVHFCFCFSCRFCCGLWQLDYLDELQKVSTSEQRQSFIEKLDEVISLSLNTLICICIYMYLWMPLTLTYIFLGARLVVHWWWRCFSYSISRTFGSTESYWWPNFFQVQQISVVLT